MMLDDIEIGDVVTVVATGEKGTVIDVFPGDVLPVDVCTGGLIRGFDADQLAAG